MSNSEENLPSVSELTSEFQVGEDNVMANKLQEKEYEGHYDANVEYRRTAGKDVFVAKNLEKEENLVYHRQESVRKEKLRRRELEDKVHAEEVAQKLKKEEEEIQADISMQDEFVAKQLQDEEKKRMEQKKKQEQEDARLAKQYSLEQEIARERRRKESELSEREIERIKQKQIARERRRKESELSEREIERIKQKQERR